MRPISLLPLAVLVGLSACDSTKVAQLTGVRPMSAPACSAESEPACPSVAVAGPPAAPAQAPVPAIPAPAMVAESDTCAPVTPKPTSNCVHDPVPTGAADAGQHDNVHHDLSAPRVIVIHKTYYIGGTRHKRRTPPAQKRFYLDSGLPEYPKVYVRREIDRTPWSRPLGNGYGRMDSPSTGYNGPYGEGQSPTGDCLCASSAAGRDREGYLIWPGKTEVRSQ
ncbi:MAG: hypothetical protein CGW95_12650 [Phenylobacterium zucineum]|nr:MAG: hypothetical protein CGW95_12650 [Phenylobacterium zucineum]